MTTNLEKYQKDLEQLIVNGESLVFSMIKAYNPKLYNDIYKKTYKENHTPSFNLRWEYNTALGIAEKCYPYLIIKKERAECVLRWKSVVKRNGKYTPKELRKKEELITEIRRLNKR